MKVFRSPGALLRLLSLGFALSVMARASAEQIATIDGQINKAILSIQIQKGSQAKNRLILKTKSKELPLGLVRRVQFQDKSKLTKQRSTIVVLTNGDRLRGSLEDGDEDGLTLRTLSLGKIQVSIDIVRALVIQADMDFLEVEKNLRRKDDKDIVFNKTGSQAPGTFEKVTKTGIVMEVDQAGTLSINFDKVKMVLLSLLDEVPEFKKGVVVRLQLLDGASLTGRLISLVGADLTVETLLGKKTVIKRSDLYEMLVLNGAFVYLSDREPSKVLQKFDGFKFYPEIYGWKRDRNVMGGVLKLGGKTYEKGLGVHSFCQLNFDLGGQFKAFRSTIGLDDSVKFLGQPGLGSVRFRILVDGQACKEYPKGILQQKESVPQKIEVDVEKAKTLTLIADYGRTLHILGRANWAEAHLIRELK